MKDFGIHYERRLWKKTQENVIHYQIKDVAVKKINLLSMLFVIVLSLINDRDPLY